MPDTYDPWNTGDIPWDPDFISFDPQPGVPTPAPPPVDTSSTDGLFSQPLPHPLRWTGTPGGGQGYVRLYNVGTVAEFTAGWRVLAELVRLWNIIVVPYTNERYSGGYGAMFTLPHTVVIKAPGVETYGATGFSFEPSECYECHAVIEIGVPTCHGCGVTQHCARCGQWQPNLVSDSHHGGLCSNCAVPCEECGVSSEFPRCDTHASGQRYWCVRCDSYTDEGMGAEYSEYYDGIVCEGCLPSLCARCDRETGETFDGLCEDCDMAEQHLGHGTEEFEPEEKLERDMFIDAIPGRENIRRCGIEIEGGGNWRNMGQRLFDAGLTRAPRMAEYHAATSGQERDLWSLERDGSVDWELVSPPINLADRDNVRSLRGVLKIVREEIKSETVNFDMRCGLHIHVSAERTAIGGAFNLGTVWGYLEDVIFRLGAAKWPKHRAIINGVHYCRPTQKGAKTRLEFGLQLEHQDEARYNALSFNNYIRSMSRNCSCGAVRYDSWDQCVCDLGKCTFEFRVFNTSANMHKIHAYLALCQALVAFSTNLPDLDPEQYPAQTFVPKLVADLGPAIQPDHIDAWRPRLEFIFNELPLTDPEKADLLYCVRSSELAALGNEFIDSLAPMNAQEVLV